MMMMMIMGSSRVQKDVGLVFQVPVTNRQEEGKGNKVGVSTFIDVNN